MGITAIQIAENGSTLPTDTTWLPALTLKRGVVNSIHTPALGSCYGSVMIRLLKQILNDEGQDPKRLALIVLLLTLGTITSQYLAHRMLPGTGRPHFTVRASP